MNPNFANEASAVAVPINNIGMYESPNPSALFNKAGEILKIRLSQYSMHECQTASRNGKSNEPIGKITAFLARAICFLSFFSRPFFLTFLLCRGGFRHKCHSVGSKDSTLIWEHVLYPSWLEVALHDRSILTEGPRGQ